MHKDEFEKLFSESRRELPNRYRSISATERALSVSRTTARRLLDFEIKDGAFSLPTKKSVVNLVNPSSSGIYYKEIVKISKISNDEIADVKEYSGFYKYLRYNIQQRFVQGAIKIEKHGKAWAFKHWNKSQDQYGFDEETPNHLGYVFIIGGRLYLMGIGPRYIRPAICNTVSDVRRELVDGVVIAVSQDDGALFSANFVMIHESHTGYQQPDFSALESRVKAGNYLTGIIWPKSD